MAYVIADRDALFSIFSDPDKFTAAAPYNFLFAALLVLIFGAGEISADRGLAHLVGGRGAKQGETSIAV